MQVMNVRIKGLHRQSFPNLKKKKCYNSSPAYYVFHVEWMRYWDAQFGGMEIVPGADVEWA